MSQPTPVARLEELGQLVWGLSSVRETAFDSARGGDRVTALLLSKATFVQAVSIIYKTFDHRDVYKLQYGMHSLFRLRLYLASVRRLRLCLYHGQGHVECASICSLQDALPLYPNVQEIFWDGCIHPYTLVLPGASDAAPKPRVALQWHGRALAHCFNEDQVALVSNGGPRVPAVSIYPEWDLQRLGFPPNWDVYTSVHPREDTKVQSQVDWIDMPNTFWQTIAQHVMLEISMYLEPIMLLTLILIRAHSPGAKRLAGLILKTSLQRRDWLIDSIQHCGQLRELRVRHDHDWKARSAVLSPLVDIYDYLSVALGTDSTTLLRPSEIIEISLAHPALVSMDPRPTAATLRRLLGLGRPLRPNSSLQQPLDRVERSVPQPRPASRGGKPRGEMREMILHILLPFAMPSIPRSDETLVTARLAHLIEPEEQLVRSLLHIGGPTCDYRLDAVFEADTSDCAVRIAADVSKRFMECFESHRNSIEARTDAREGSRGGSKAKKRKRV